MSNSLPKSEPPFKPGQWVMDGTENHSPIFGTVKAIHRNDLPWEDKDKFNLDLVVYTPHGVKLGRRSSPEGGPKTYEPCIPAERFVLIEEPNFPLNIDRFTRQYGHLLRRVGT